MANKRKTIDINTIEPNPDNPRQMTSDDFEGLVKSIKRDPQYLDKRGIVIADGTILGGNMRYYAILEALKDPEFRRQAGVQSEDEIPAKWVLDASDWTDEQKRRFTIVDNAPHGIAGDWDYDTMANQYDLEELTEWGFREADLSDALNINLNPHVSEHEGTSGDVDKSQSKLDHQFDNTKKKKDVMCPNCGEEFYVDE